MWPPDSRSVADTEYSYDSRIGTVSKQLDTFMEPIKFFEKEIKTQVSTFITWFNQDNDISIFPKSDSHEYNLEDLFNVVIPTIFEINQSKYDQRVNCKIQKICQLWQFLHEAYKKSIHDYQIYIHSDTNDDNFSTFKDNGEIQQKIKEIETLFTSLKVCYNDENIRKYNDIGNNSATLLYNFKKFGIVSSDCITAVYKLPDSESFNAISEKDKATIRTCVAVDRQDLMTEIFDIISIDNSPFHLWKMKALIAGLAGLGQSDKASLDAFNKLNDWYTSIVETIKQKKAEAEAAEAAEAASSAGGRKRKSLKKKKKSRKKKKSLKKKKNRKKKNKKSKRR